MPYISEYVEVNETEKSVRFFGEEWIEVEDLDVWIASFWDAARDIACQINGCASVIERHAFNQVT